MHDWIVHFKPVPELELLLKLLNASFNEFFAISCLLIKLLEQGRPPLRLRPDNIGVVAKSEDEFL
jgi:hypothetical protein